MGNITPPDIVVGMFMQCWQSLAILAAANLGVADAVDTAPRHVDEIAQRLKVHPQALFRLMRALSARGIFRQSGEREFAHSALSRSLISGAPGGAREQICSVGLASSRAATAAYEETIATGTSALQLTHGAGGAFDRLAEDPDAAHAYDSGMTALAMAQAEALNASVDFSHFHTIVDVGGGHGALLGSILERNPAQRGILFDLPRVVAGSSGVFKHYGVADRCAVQGGDFNATIPPGADAYILKNVLHGYNDAYCQNLLQRIRASAAPGAHLFIIELVMPSQSGAVAQTTFDLFLMLGGIDSRVRSEAEFRALLTAAGFDLLEVVPTQSLACVVKAVARPDTQRVADESH